MGTVLWTATKLRSTLPTPRSPLVALRISTRGLGWAVRQESSLAVRHWWPATVAAACFSRHARGALLTAVAVDGVVALAQSRNEPDRPRVAVVLAGRRLDDLAYGAGLWWGSLRGRSASALMTRSPRRHTVARRRATLNSALEQAVELELMTVNPHRKFPH